MRIVTDYKHAQQIIIELDARIAKLEADATCWTHGMNKEGTIGGMYLKANCPDCTAHIAKLESALRGYVKATTGQESATVTFPMALKGEGK